MNEGRVDGPVLGLAAFQRGACAALVVDQRIVAVAEESWFSRRADEDGFPRRAAHACLRAGGIELGDLRRVVLAEKPLARFERLLATQLAAFPRSARAFAGTMFTWLGDRLWIKGRIVEEFVQPPERVAFVPRLVAHAAGAVAQLGIAPDEDACVLVVDDGGEWGTTALARAVRGRVEMLAELAFPHSLGAVAHAVERFLGRTPGVEPGWLEVLGARGRDRFRADFDELVAPAADGAFRVAPDVWRFSPDGERVWSSAVERRFGRARKAGEPFDADAALAERDADLAASFNALLERRVLDLVRELHARVPARTLVVTGLVALNRRLVAFLAENGPFADVRVPAAPWTGGLAIGAAAHIAGGVSGGRAELASAESALPPLAGAAPRAFRELIDGSAVAWLESGLAIGPESPRHRLVVARPDREGVVSRLLGPLAREGVGMGVRVLAREGDASKWADVERGSAGTDRARGAPRAKPALIERARDAIEPDGRVHLDVVSHDARPALHELLCRVEGATGAALLAATDLRARGMPAALSAEDVLEALERAGLDAVFVDGIEGTREELAATMRSAPDAIAATSA